MQDIPLEKQSFCQLGTQCVWVRRMMATSPGETALEVTAAGQRTPEGLYLQASELWTSDHVLLVQALFHDDISWGVKHFHVLVLVHGHLHFTIALVSCRASQRSLNPAAPRQPASRLAAASSAEGSACGAGRTMVCAWKTGLAAS